MQKLFDIFSEVLGIENVNLETSSEDTESWDSFAHLQIVAEVEERFKIKIPFEEILQIKKVGDFLKYIKA